MYDREIEGAENTVEEGRGFYSWVETTVSSSQYVESQVNSIS